MTDTTGKMRENRVISEGVSGIYPHGPVYHWRGGWLFCRGEGLDVNVWNHEKEIDLTIPRAEWESIVAALSTAHAGKQELSEEDRQQIIEAKVCALTFPNSAKAVVSELLTIIDRLTGRSEEK